MKFLARADLVWLLLIVLALLSGCSQERTAGEKMSPETAAQASEANQRKSAHNMR